MKTSIIALFLTLSLATLSEAKSEKFSETNLVRRSTLGGYTKDVTFEQVIRKNSNFEKREVPARGSRRRIGKKVNGGYRNSRYPRKTTKKKPSSPFPFGLPVTPQVPPIPTLPGVGKGGLPGLGKGGLPGLGKDGLPGLGKGGLPGLGKGGLPSEVTGITKGVSSIGGGSALSSAGKLPIGGLPVDKLPLDKLPAKDLTGKLPVGSVGKIVTGK